MKLNHHVVVVGGGPAGSTAAYTLAKQGIDVCVIDKSTFPRDKLCGGLLTLRSKKIFEAVFGEEWKESFEYRSTGVSFYGPEGKLNGAYDYSELFFTNRHSFDNHLLELAKGVGAVTYEGQGIRDIDLKNKVCYLASGDQIHYTYLIGADGVNSIVAKTIYGSSFNKKTIGFALEMEVDRKCLHRVVNTPEVYFGFIRWGYGWIFPKEHSLTVGIGGLHMKNPEMKADFKRFLTHIFGEVPSAKIKGHYIPLGDYRKKPGTTDVLLSGDAAGLVESITGEGIAFAMQSGHLAATSLVEAIESEDRLDAFKIYATRFKEIASILDYGNILRFLIFPDFSNKLFLKILPKTSMLTRKHMDLMADELEYPEYMKYIAGKIVKGLVRHVGLPIR